MYNIRTKRILLFLLGFMGGFLLLELVRLIISDIIALNDINIFLWGFATGAWISTMIWIIADYIHRKTKKVRISR